MEPILRIAMELPGRVLFGASDFALPYPFGGTELGFVGNVAVQPQEPTQDITDPTTGTTLDVVSTGLSMVLSCRVRDFDPDAINRVFLNTSAGAVTQRRRIDIGGVNRAGYLYSERAGTFTYVPDAVVAGDDDVHRIVHFYNAVPRQQEGFEILLRLGSKAELPIEVEALPDASGNLGSMFFRGDQ